MSLAWSWPVARRAILPLAGLAAVAGGLVFLVHAVGGPQGLQLAVEATGPWAPLAFVGLRVLTYVVAPLSGAPLKVSSGALFGLVGGAAYTLLGDVLGASLNYWIARVFGRRVVAPLVGPAGVQRVDALGRRLGDWRSLVACRVALAPAYDFVSYAAGLVPGVAFPRFVLITAVAGLPDVLFWAGFGASLGEANRDWLWLYAGSGVCFLVASVAGPALVRARSGRSPEGGR